MVSPLTQHIPHLHLQGRAQRIIDTNKKVVFLIQSFKIGRSMTDTRGFLLLSICRWEQAKINIQDGFKKKKKRQAPRRLT